MGEHSVILKNTAILKAVHMAWCTLLHRQRTTSKKVSQVVPTSRPRYFGFIMQALSAAQFPSSSPRSSRQSMLFTVVPYRIHCLTAQSELTHLASVIEEAQSVMMMRGVDHQSHIRETHEK